MSLVLADDHSFLRLGVRTLLEDAPGIDEIAEAETGSQALALIDAHRPDAVVSDISMPDLDGLELAARVARDYPQTRVLILSMHSEKAYATRALSSGASGYLVKGARASELEQAVRAVARGEAYLSPEVSAHVVADHSRLARAEAQAADPFLFSF